MITYDSAGVGSFAAGGTTATWQHVIGASATALIVGVSFSGGSPNTTTRTVTVGNKTLASIGVLQSSPTAWTELFGIMGPSTGAQTVNVRTSVSVAKTANSVAYKGVVSFGSVSLSTPSSTYTVTQPATSGNWVVGVFGTATAVTIAPLATSGTARYVKSSTPTLAIVDDLSEATSATLQLNAATTPPAAVITIALSPVPGSTGWSYTGNAGTRAVTASTTASASVTSIRQASTALVVAATASAAISVVGQRDFASSLTVAAARTASMLVNWSANVSLTAVATPLAKRESSLWIFNSSLAATVTRTATATVTPAVIPPPATHSPLRYVGRYPDTEGSVAPRSYGIAANDRTKVTSDFINKTVDSLVHPLAKTEYVDQQDKTKALKSDVLAADELYFPATGHGLATLDSDGFVVANQIPGSINTNRVAGCYVGSNVGSGTVTSSGYRSLLLSTVTIPYPGFPYVVMPFGWVTGSDPNGVLKSRWYGTGSTGRIVVLPTTGSDSVCGWGICAGTAKQSSYPLTPAVSMSIRNQQFTGNITLGLYGSVLAEATGRSYVFAGGSFYVLVFPAV